MGKRGVIHQLLLSLRPQPAMDRPRKGSALLEMLEARQLLSAAAAPVVNAVWEGQNVKVVQGQYVVELTSTANISKLVKESNFQDLTSMGSGNFYSLTSDKSITQMEKWAAKRPTSVIAMTPNVITQVADLSLPNDPYFSDQWQYNNTGQIVPGPQFDPTGEISYETLGHVGGAAGTPGDDISAGQAWSIVRGDPNANDPSKEIVVAVLDSGIDPTHPDLVNELWTNPREIPNNGIDDDGDGFVDDVNGWNFVAGNNNITDDNGHGTHVSGIIGAQGNNGIGVTGVIQTVKILPVKIGSAQGTLTTIDIINGIQYVTTLKNEGVNIVVANGSFGGTDFPFNRVENDAVSRMGQAGTLFTVAAGNDAADLDPSQSFPGKFSLNQPNVITVAATDNNDQIAFFSNIGATSVDIAAPGLNILSTFPTYDVGTYLQNGTLIPSNTLDYGYDSGTSMAAPMVAGAIALMKAAKPDASMMELKNALLAGADHIAALDKPIDAGSPLVSTAGRLNVYKAILNLLNQRTNVDTSTRGSWNGVYGTDGAVVYGETGTLSQYSNSFANVQVTGATLQVYADTSKDPDALQQQLDPSSRIASQLSSAGAITLDLEFTDGKSHRVSLYQADLTNHPGAQNITLIDPDTGDTIASYKTGDLSTGEYDTFEVNPPSSLPDGSIYRVRVVITPSGGTNAVLNGIFFDPATTDDAALVTSTPVAGVTKVVGGDWRQQYGSEGADIFGSGTTLGDAVTVDGGTQVVKNGKYKKSDAATVLPKGKNSKQRIAGYMQTKDSMDIHVDLSSYSTPQKLTLYAADFEKQGRAERLDLYDDATGDLISSVDLTNFSGGKYVSWMVSGNVTIHVTRLAGQTAVVSGVFIDATPGAPIEYVGMDTTSSGNWKTYYGADAAFVFGSDSAPVRQSTYSADLNYGRSNPESETKVQTVTVKVTNGVNNPPHVVISKDSRYPLLPSSTSFQHVANPKTTGNSMNVDLQFTDQRVHTVAIYMVDPDKKGTRAQKVDLQLYNPQTGQAYTVAGQIVTNFSGGKYVVFNVSKSVANAPYDVRVKITRLSGKTAVVNGVFIG